MQHISGLPEQNQNFSIVIIYNEDTKKIIEPTFLETTIDKKIKLTYGDIIS